MKYFIYTTAAQNQSETEKMQGIRTKFQVCEETETKYDQRIILDL